MIERSNLSQPERNGGLVEGFQEFFEATMPDEVKGLANRASKDVTLTVPFEAVESYNSEYIEMIYQEPDLIIHNMGVAASEMAGSDVDSVQIRLSEPFEERMIAVREIRDENVDNLVSIEGIVSQHIEVKPKIHIGEFRCSSCGAITQKLQPAENLAKPVRCIDEECGNTTPSNFYVQYESSKTVNFQKIRLQEPPSHLEGGEDPQKIDVLLTGNDITGVVRGGEKVTVSGVLRTTESNDRSVLNTYIDANNLEKEDKGTEDMDITDEEEARIKELSQRDDIYEVITESVAPSIKGHESAKRGAAFQAFGGVRKKFEDSDTTIRGDIHVLYVGDPGVGKSQILQYIQNVSTSGVYTSGKGSSSAGLCVGGDTVIQYDGELITIKELVEDYISEPVEEPTAVEKPFETVAFDGDTTTERTASHIWRMPEQEALTFTTQKGRELTVSPQTPLLVSTEDGVEWIEAGDITKGDHIASPSHIDYEQRAPSPMEYFEFENENIGLSSESRERIRNALSETFGTLRNAADELGFGEDFMYDTLLNRKVPFDRLQRILNVTNLTLDSLSIESVELRHGKEVEIPNEFSDDLLWLIGLIFGDGSLSVSEDRETIRISNSDEDVLTNAAMVFESEFGIYPQIEIPDSDIRPPEIRVGSKTLVKFLRNIGMGTPPKTNIELDSKIALSHLRRPFLTGYFDADGSVNTRTGNGGTSVSISSVSQSIINQVQLLLLYEGIDSRTRERERAGDVNQLGDGRTIVSRRNQYELSISGSDIPEFADAVGFSQSDKSETLNALCSEIEYRGSIEGVKTATETGTGTVLQLGQDHVESSEATQSLRWNIVTDISVTTEELYDLTTVQSNFIANGLVVHNTASAVRDAEFGGNDQWTLKAGAMVIADKGVACIDELDKMDSNDRSAMHEALEQQQVSISKAGINATLKSRCSLLAAANPIHGRFDEYEPVPEQINLEPALISRFDLIFIIQDQPDEDTDSMIADHILERNRQGQKNARMISQGEELDEVGESEGVAEISQDLLRKYIAYAKRNVYPEMTDSAKDKVRDFYVHLRNEEVDTDAIPITARKLEALVRLSEASARIRLSETVTVDDAQRAIDIMMEHLKEVGMDPETGEFDADMLESGTPQSQRDRIKTLLQAIDTIVDEKESQEDFDGRAVASIDEIEEKMDGFDLERDEIEDQLSRLARDGQVYSPGSGDGYCTI